jgi:hypothetical protein
MAYRRFSEWLKIREDFEVDMAKASQAAAKRPGDSGVDAVTQVAQDTIADPNASAVDKGKAQATMDAANNKPAAQTATPTMKKKQKKKQKKK